MKPVNTALHIYNTMRPILPRNRLQKMGALAKKLKAALLMEEHLRSRKTTGHLLERNRRKLISIAEALLAAALRPDA